MGWEQLRDTPESDLVAQWDAVWILPGSDYDMLRQLAKPGGSVDRFAHRGGIVVIPGILAGAFHIDVAPGGFDVLSEADPGPTTIAAPNHPLIDATESGGVNLTATDLDPDGTGGGGCFAPAPLGMSLVAIAENNVGPVLAESVQAEGRVLMSLFEMLGSNCLNNMLIYVESLSP
jgi:hypothetical protein